MSSGSTARGYRLSEVQAQAILDMRLHRLTGLEQDKIVAEYRELLERDRRSVGDPRAAGTPDGGGARRARRDPRQLWRRAPHRDQPRSPEPVHRGPDRAAGRGGDALARRLRQGAAGVRLPGAAPRRPRQVAPPRSRTRISSRSSSSRTRTTRCCASPIAARSTGCACSSCRRPAAVRAASRSSTCCRWKRARRSTRVLPVKQFDEQHYVFMATSCGTVKKTPLAAFSRPRASGIIAVDLRDDDRLVGVALTDGTRRDHACAPAAARRSVSMRRKCGRWDARPPACAACASATASA